MHRHQQGADVIAHRGASAYAAEHTLAAYDLALDQGADVLELDVRATADGDAVVVHDSTLQRTAGDPRRVDALTLAEVAGLPDATRPLTLEAVFARYGASTRYLVDVKEPARWWEGAIAEAVERHGLRDHVVVQSFDAAALRRLRAATPWLACAPLYERRPSGRLLDAAARWACGVGVIHGRVDAALVAAVHARGLALRAWTINAPEAIDRALALGVDGVITDVPDVAFELRAAAFEHTALVAA